MNQLVTPYLKLLLTQQVITQIFDPMGLIGLIIGSFNRDARNLLDHGSHDVVKMTSVKCVVNCLVVYGKSP